MKKKKYENAMENDQNYIYQFHYKGNVLAEPQGSAQHSLNTTAVEKGLKKWVPQLDTNMNNFT